MKFSATLFAALTSLTIVSAANLPSMFRRSSNLPICERSITLSNDYAEDAFKKCKELGIDPLGSPPNDFTSDDRGVITFDGDSKYALWHAAQNARTDDLRRRGSDIGVTMYASTDCTGSGKSYPNLIYLEQNHDSHVDHSLAIGGRSVNSNVERIWLATYDGTSCHDAALNYYVYGPVGCAKNLPTYQCVILRLTSENP